MLTLKTQGMAIAVNTVGRDLILLPIMIQLFASWYGASHFDFWMFWLICILWYHLKDLHWKAGQPF
jgi:hypothetical protein